MIKLNKIVRAFTHEGARAKRFTPEMELKRALMNCLLWEDQFYEDGVAIAERIKALVPKVEPKRVAALAIEARLRSTGRMRSARSSSASVSRSRRKSRRVWRAR
jgi:hypothetical protein